MTKLCSQLLAYDPAKGLPVSAFPLSILPEAHPSISCFQALDYLYAIYLLTRASLTFNISQTGRAHLLLVSRTPGKVGGAIGILTLEGMLFRAFLS